MAPKKSTPKGIDPANPQKNFVKAYYDNRGDREGFDEYMYGPSGTWDKKGNYIAPDTSKKSSGYGHSIGQRAGKLRLSGAKGAHRIGKRG